MPYVLGNLRRALLASKLANLALTTVNGRAALVMPYGQRARLGDDDNSGTLAPAIAQWQAEVRARGNVPTRMPKGPNVGKLAERYVDRQGTYRYAIASKPALEADGRGAAVLAQQIRAGRQIEDLEKSVDLLKQGAKAALDLPRQAAAGVLGIPPWAITALLLGGGVLVVKTLLPSLPAMVTRRNPPRRRVRRRR